MSIARSKPTKSPSPLPIAEAIAIHEALKPVIVPVTPPSDDNPGSCFYAEGHSDSTVATQLGKPTEKINLVRVQTFGMLVPRSREEAVSTPYLHGVLSGLVSILYNEDVLSSEQYQRFTHQLTIPAE